MGILIDTSVLIQYERLRSDPRQSLREWEDEEFFLSVVSASELLHGVFRAREPSVRARRSALVEAVLEGFPLLPVDLAAARAHAQLGAELAAAGTPIGPNDLWLAASAVAHGLTLLTANTREFNRVPGLDVRSLPT